MSISPQHPEKRTFFPYEDRELELKNGNQIDAIERKMEDDLKESETRERELIPPLRKSMKELDM